MISDLFLFIYLKFIVIPFSFFFFFRVVVDFGWDLNFNIVEFRLSAQFCCKKGRVYETFILETLNPTENCKVLVQFLLPSCSWNICHLLHDLESNLGKSIPCLDASPQGFPIGTYFSNSACKINIVLCTLNKTKSFVTSKNH